MKIFKCLVEVYEYMYKIEVLYFVFLLLFVIQVHRYPIMRDELFEFWAMLNTTRRNDAFIYTMYKGKFYLKRQGKTIMRCNLHLLPSIDWFSSEPKSQTEARADY